MSFPSLLHVVPLLSYFPPLPLTIISKTPTKTKQKEARSLSDVFITKTQIRPALLPTLLISILTIFPVLFVTPLYLAQRRIYNPSVALFLDLGACLFWLGVFAVLAAYEDVFRGYGRGVDGLEGAIEGEVIEECWECRRAWRSGVASCVFVGVEL